MPRVLMQSESGETLFEAAYSNKVVVVLLPVSIALVSFAIIFNRKNAAINQLIVLAPIMMLWLLVWLWQLVGRHVLEIAPGKLVQRSILLGLSFRKAYAMASIHAPRFVAASPSGHGNTSGIAFDYNGKRAAICNGIRQHQARELVTAILHKYPQLGPVWHHYAAGVPESKHSIFMKRI